MRVHEYFLESSDKRWVATKVYKKIKSNELKKDHESHSDYCQYENDAKKKYHYKDTSKLHNKMYHHNKVPKQKGLCAVLIFNMKI